MTLNKNSICNNCLLSSTCGLKQAYEAFKEDNTITTKKCSCYVPIKIN